MNKWYKNIIPDWGFFPPGDPSLIAPEGVNQFVTEGTPLPSVESPAESRPSVPAGFEAVDPAALTALKQKSLFGPTLPATVSEAEAPGIPVLGVVTPGPQGTFAPAAVKPTPSFVPPLESQQIPGYAYAKHALEKDISGKGVAKLADLFTDEGNIVSTVTNLLPMPGAAGGKAAMPLALGVFGGPMAKGFKKATGVFSHLADQMPRFEIPDALMRMRDLDTWALKGPGGKYISKPGATLKDVIDHPDLFSNYPQFGDIKINFKYDPRGMQKAERASYSPSTNSINMYQLKGSKEDILHEIQHAIQQYEGFAKGGSYRDMPRYLAAADRIMQNPASDAELKEWATKIYTIAGGPDVPALDRSYKMYKALLGEIEAGHVEFRSMFSPEELKKVQPFAMTPELERTLVAKESVIPRKEVKGVGRETEPTVRPPQAERLQGIMQRETEDLLTPEYERAGFTEAVQARREASFGEPTAKTPVSRTGQAVELPTPISDYVMDKVGTLGEARAVQQMIDKGVVSDVAAGKKLIKDIQGSVSPETVKMHKDLGPVVSGDLGIRPAKNGKLQISNEIPLMRTAVQEGEAKYGAEWFKKIREANKTNPTYSEEQLTTFENNLQSIAARLQRNDALPVAITTPEGKQIYSPLKGNRFEGPQPGMPGESVDVTSICPKRKEMEKAIADQQLTLGRGLSKEELLGLRQNLKNQGLPVSCGACYVSRLEMGTILNEAIKANPNIPKEMFLSQEGLDYLKAYYPDVYTDVGKRMGPRGIKMPESYSEIDGQILKLSQKKVDGYNSRRGLRFQSWSDMEVPHVLDLMKAATEASMRKLATYAYTKVADYVDVMAPTGQFINQSAMPKGPTGLDKAGKLVFDDVEGIPFAAAMRNRTKFADNVGIELMGVSDDQIRVALADPRIDTVIPYHRSGLSKELREKYVAQGWKDYQNEQIEHFVGTARGKIDKAAEKKLDWYEIQNSMPKGTKPEAIADEYLKRCDEMKIVPRFAQFRKEPNYYKLLVDRKQYNSATGTLAQFGPTKANFDMPSVNRILNRYLKGEWSPYQVSK